LRTVDDEQVIARVAYQLAMKRDLIGVVEAIYAEARDDPTWLHAIADAAFPIVDVGLGMAAYSFHLDSTAVVPTILDAVSLGTYGRELLLSARNMLAEAGPGSGRSSLRGFRSQVGVLSELVVPPYVEVDFLERHLKLLGDIGNAKDQLGIVAADSSGMGVVLFAFLPAGWRLTPAFRHRWRHIVAHLATGIRLRTGSESLPDEAVLDAGGKLYDASAKAASRDAQVALRQAARAIDRARVRRSREPDGALEAWHALVAARWSLVDRFESDGRSFLIAKPNPPRPPPTGTLTPRERAVVALAALGRSNKLIAYELGLSAGAVGNYLARAQHKLGAGSRATLIRLWHAAALDVEHAVESVS
jgi:DNA-binding CsgD family transcriptional regulator